MKKNNKTILIIGGVLLLYAISSAFSPSANPDKLNSKITPTQTVTVTTIISPTATITTNPTASPTPTVTKSAQQKIAENVYKTAKYFVLISDDANRIDSRAKPPFDIVVNTYGSEAGNPASCFYGKNVAYQIIKNLYADSELRPMIGRVLVNASPYVSASLGANDAIPVVEKDPTLGGGPSFFWDVLSSASSTVNNKLPLKDRTWGETLSGCR